MKKSREIKKKIAKFVNYDEMTNSHDFLYVYQFVIIRLHTLCLSTFI